jgi:hypothetical protein
MDPEQNLIVPRRNANVSEVGFFEAKVRVSSIVNRTGRW